jgi:nicotinate-nucleotide--dimethylbenzimidazole phosphoribosyltransferase
MERTVEISSISQIVRGINPIDASWIEKARTRTSQLAIPPRALGRLHDIAERCCAIGQTLTPDTDRKAILVMAGDHGVAIDGVSAFPQEVTAEMLKNFARGGAAICVAAQTLNADLEVINLGTVHDTVTLDAVQSCRLGPGTANLTHQAAMTEHQLAQSLNAGRHTAKSALHKGSHLFIGGEMGIGNTSAATALACALLDLPPERLAGPGTGLDAKGISHKTKVIQQALAYHHNHHSAPLEAVRRLGGFEIAALTGSYIACAHMGLPILVDGFISSVAALAATRLCPGVEHWCLFSHTSAEPGHRIVLNALNAQPLLDLGMRLGEGSGAATAVPLLRLACALHNDMATFAEAGVSEKSS